MEGADQKGGVASSMPLGAPTCNQKLLRFDGLPMKILAFAALPAFDPTTAYVQCIQYIARHFFQYVIF